MSLSGESFDLSKQAPLEGPLSAEGRRGNLSAPNDKTRKGSVEVSSGEGRRGRINLSAESVSKLGVAGAGMRGTVGLEACVSGKGFSDTDYPVLSSPCRRGSQDGLRRTLTAGMSSQDIMADMHGLRQGSLDGANLSKEEQLKRLLTQDSLLEDMMTRMRKEHSEFSTLQAKQAEWEDAHPVSAHLVLIPASKMQVRWDAFVLLLLVCSAVILPLEVAYDLSRTPLAISLLSCLDACFIADFALGFRTAFVFSHPAFEKIVKHPLEIARHYLRGYFWLDLLCALPLGLIYEMTDLDTVAFIELIKLIRLLRLCKLPRVLANNQAWALLQLRVNSAVLQLAEGLTFLIFTNHLMGCIYCVVVRHEVRESNHLAITQQSHLLRSREA